MTDKKPSQLEARFKQFAANLEYMADTPHRRRLEQKARKAREIPYATFNDRVFASVIDTSVSFVLLAPIFMGVSNMMYGSQRENPLLGLPEGAPVPDIIAHLQRTNYFSTMFADYLVHYSIFAIVILWLWNMGSCTPGKWVLRMRIADAKSFRKPTPKQFVLRYVGYVASLLPFTAGFMWVMVDKKGRGWHDIIADTVVVKVKHWRFKDDGTQPFVTIPHGKESKSDIDNNS
jgi:uncharacterized RDD family membrane protein YckC